MAENKRAMGRPLRYEEPMELYHARLRAEDVEVIMTETGAQKTSEAIRIAVESLAERIRRQAAK